MGPGSSAGSRGGRCTGQVGDDAVERRGPYREELTGGGASWALAELEVKCSVCAGYWGAVVLETDMGGRQVWAWPAEEAGVSRMAGVSGLSCRIYGTWSSGARLARLQLRA